MSALLKLMAVIVREQTRAWLATFFDTKAVR